jgi:4-hydroxy-tetrahydrodipicolinate synthase
MTLTQKAFIPVMLTPFKNNGAVDYKALTELTEFYLNAGATGLFANCQSSEMFKLTDAERLSVTQHILNIAAGAVPIVAAGTFGGLITKQADFVKRMYDTGVEAVIVITNMLAGEWEANEAFDLRFHKLLDSTSGIPLGFYECPAPYKRILSPSQLGDFVNTGRVIYHKDTCLDIDLVKAKLGATRHVAGFGLYDAYIIHAVDSLRAGSAGLSCIQGNYFPELIVWLCRHYNDPSCTAAIQRVQQFFIDRMNVMHTVYPTVAKYFLHKRGLHITTFTREFAGVFDDHTRGQVDELFNDYKILYNELDIKPAGILKMEG